MEILQNCLFLLQARVLLIDKIFQPSLNFVDNERVCIMFHFSNTSFH